jgi:crotonobetainyl-CoA:carnitine CoA-transferase CaiB-like acyl-CoA transferase
VTLPLEGLLVADFTRAVAGPFCTMLLGDLGARVVKIEDPASGDETRRWGPPFIGGTATYFYSINRNKESVALDLKSGAGIAAAQELVNQVDVVIENFRPGAMERLGLGYAKVAAANPRAVYCSISGFGQTGPWAKRAGYDMIVQALSGCMHHTGTEETGPAKVAFPASDVLTALFASNAILAALYRRERDGLGRYVEVCLLESILCAMSNLSTATLTSGQEPARFGTAQGNIVPYQVFRCKGGLMAAGAPNERLWRRFCQALGRPEWADDPRYKDNPSRTQHRAELVAAIEEILLTQTAAHWTEVCEQHEIPCGAVNTLADIFAEPALAGRGAIAEMPLEDGTILRTVANPMRFAGADYTYRRPPKLGEHGSTP